MIKFLCEENIKYIYNKPNNMVIESNCLKEGYSKDTLRKWQQSK